MAPYPPGYLNTPEIYHSRRRKKWIIWRKLVTTLFGLFLHLLSISKEVRSIGEQYSHEDLFSMGKLNCSGKNI